MRNCVVLGSGRSGTSMVAGTLSGAGYFMGHRPMPPTSSNPKGYFESFDIQEINEELLAPVVPKRPRFLSRWLFRDRPGRNQLWLARVAVGTRIPGSSATNARIGAMVQNEPYCFKDPRFSYTLPAWRPFLRNAVFICVFRDPASTAASILSDCADSRYLRDLFMDFERAVDVWTLMYRHILEIHRYDGAWLFLHYNQGLTEEGIRRLEVFVEARLEGTFPDPALCRSFSNRSVPPQTRVLYEELCGLADFKGH